MKELVAIARKLQGQGKKVVQCHGTFDLMHPGHIEHLQLAKNQGDILIVSVTADHLIRKGPGHPVFPQVLRLQSVAALECVDYVLLDELGEGPALIRLIKPDVFAKGPDYVAALGVAGSHTDLERRAVEAGGGSFHITGSRTVFSSTKFINQYFNLFSEEAAKFLNVFRKNHSWEEIDRWLKALAHKRILVIGDAIIDEYHYCKPLGMSAKENLISVNYDEEESFVGGAVATANHIAGFCEEEVGLFSLLGRGDSRADFIRRHLQKNIKPFFVYRDDGPTVVIRRYLESVFLKKYFQLYFHNPFVSEKLDKQIARVLRPLLKIYDIVVVNDFGLGFLGKHSIALISQYGKYVAVNTQTNSSNRGYNLITKYPRVDYVCIDEPEIRLATHSRHDPIPALIKEFAPRLGCAAFTVTLGHEGSLGYDTAQDVFYRTPVFSGKVVDRVGAGDAYFSITAPLVAIGAPMDIVGFLGNIMGAIAVTIVGNKRSIDYRELSKAASGLLK